MKIFSKKKVTTDAEAKTVAESRQEKIMASLVTKIRKEATDLNTGTFAYSDFGPSTYNDKLSTGA